MNVQHAIRTADVSRSSVTSIPSACLTVLVLTNRPQYLGRCKFTIHIHPVSAISEILYNHKLITQIVTQSNNTDYCTMLHVRTVRLAVCFACGNARSHLLSVEWREYNKYFHGQCQSNVPTLGHTKQMCEAARKQHPAHIKCCAQVM